MNFIKATGAAFNLSEIFLNFPLKKLKTSCEDCLRIIGNRHRNFLIMRIFKEHFKTVISDIIENNVTFKLPSGKNESFIHMLLFKGDSFKQLRLKGKWKDVDFLKSLFTGYQLCLSIRPKNRIPKTKNIYINKEMTDKITKYTNEGKTYC